MKILLVEDDQKVSDFIKSAMKAEGFEVDVVSDGELGLKQALLNAYDLIILDYLLPNMTGEQICQKVRAVSEVPILMLSINADTKTKVDLINLGADDYLAKPFSFDELLARVRAILRRPQNISNEIIKIDNLVIDTNKHSVSRGKNEIELTPKEFQLLKYLAKNQGVVMSRGKIIEHVWDMNADIFSNTIEVHIANLRRKIDTRGNKKLVYTIPTKGYKIELKNK